MADKKGKPTPAPKKKGSVVKYTGGPGPKNVPGTRDGTPPPKVKKERGRRQSDKEQQVRDKAAESYRLGGEKIQRESDGGGMY